MRRREFLKKIGAAAVLGVGAIGWLAKKAAPRKFMRAVATKAYPGSLKTLRDISKTGRWSG